MSMRTTTDHARFHSYTVNDMRYIDCPHCEHVVSIRRQGEACIESNILRGRIWRHIKMEHPEKITRYAQGKALLSGC